MRFKFRGASSVAIIAGFAGAGFAGALPAYGQQVDNAQTVPVSQVSGPQQAAPAQSGPQQTTTPQTQQEEPDRVVVTGSFIQGTPEDAALPVEVFDAEELEREGAPTALEFVKSLSIGGPTVGEAYYFAGAAGTGNVGVNLRGIGADKTLTLLNGRRMSENTSNIPSAAIARVEVLKDGAAVIYGADATGGVVNFITRDHFNGFEASGEYKYIDGSDGDWGVHVLGGIGDGDVNFLWSAEWEHRSRLETEERPFSSLPYAVNPAPWSPVTDLARYTPRGAQPTTGITAANQFGAPTGSGIADFTNASCNAVGGVITGSGTSVIPGVGGNTTCNYGYVSYYNLVETQDIYRIYAQMNAAINDWMDFHADVNFGETQVPKVFGSPAQPGTRGPAVATGLASQYFVPTQTNAVYAANPYAAEFFARNATGGVAPAGTTGLSINSFRAFAHGGNLVMGQGDGFGTPSRVNNQAFRVTAGVTGELPDSFSFMEGIHYDVGVTYNDGSTLQTSPDILGFRMQQALNGFGGPNCVLPTDLQPGMLGTQNPAGAGKNGCLWFNPFATRIISQPELGLANPTAGAGAAPAGTTGWDNPAELVRWLFDDRVTETKINDFTVDAVFSGETPIPLPGGNIGLAVGGQWRTVESRQTVPSNFYNGQTPCEWPLELGAQVPVATSDPRFNGCTPDKPGPFVFFATNPPDYRDRQAYSLFAEASIPLLDTLNFQAAVRRETFSGGFEATVYKVSGKWDVFGPLSIRGSYGTNYQAPPITVIPGEINNGVNSIAKANSQWLGAQTITRNDIEPETAKSWNVGAIWSSGGFTADSDLRIILDYFHIETEGEIRSLATAANIADLLFPLANATGTQVIRAGGCSLLAPSRLQLNATATSPNGVCTEGSTIANDIAVIQTEIGNGPGQTTSGFDLQADYTMAVGPGDLSFGVTVTHLTELETSAQTLDGVQIVGAVDRLGHLNFGNVVGAVAVAGPQDRGDFHINYNFGDHNFRAVVNYIKGVEDLRGPITLFPDGVSTISDYGIIGDDWLTLDFFYQIKLPGDMRLNVSVVNVFDEDPPAAREELGYDPLMGSPLGRTFEIGIKKTF
jgi:outer membrane receptor protein involved in Fe transport